jgi:hypothetical protein
MAIVGLVIVSVAPARAEDPVPVADCALAVASLIESWHAVWPVSPAARPGQLIVEDAHGRRHSITEYESMTRHLRSANAACRQQDSARVMTEMRIVSAWLAADNSGRKTLNMIAQE